MYPLLLFLHSLFRWLVLSSLLYAILRAYRGLRSHGDSRSHEDSPSQEDLGSHRGHRPGKPFTKTDDSIRHWTATIAHMQLMLGCVLYFTSPLIKLYYSPDRAVISRAAARQEISFFGIIHISLMLAAIVVITIGSALAKRRETSRDKFRTMLAWFSIALVLILLAIPWPFSPLASRPLFRTF